MKREHYEFPEGALKRSRFSKSRFAISAGGAVAGIGLGWMASTHTAMAGAVALVLLGVTVYFLRPPRRSNTSTGRSWVMPTIIIALAPIDIVDLSGGALGFKLTPWLLLSLPYAFFLLMRGRDDGRREGFGADGRGLAFTLIALAGISVLMRVADPYDLSIKRFVLAAWLISFAFLFVHRNRDVLRIVLVKATKVFLLLQGAVVFLQSLVFGGLLSFPDALTSFVQFSPVYVADQTRYNGLVGDPNRAAVDVLLLLGLAHFSARALKAEGVRVRVGAWPYLLSAVLVVVTYSRTGLVAGVLLIAIIGTQQTWRHRVALVSLLLVGVLAGSYIILSQPALLTTLELVFSNTQRQVATTTHFDLVDWGIRIVTEDPRPLLVGKGWGTEYAYTNEFFPGDEYGNFHSGYISMAVNAGVIAALVYLALLLRPAWLGSTWAPLVPVILWVNLFYQFQAEPIYWLELAALNAPIVTAAKRAEPVERDRARGGLYGRHAVVTGTPL
jgi:hypothetical protein